MLSTAHGRADARIARETAVHVDTVRSRRVRSAEQGLPGLPTASARADPPPSPRFGPQVKALAHLAAHDVHHARVFGRCELLTGIDPFMTPAARVMSQEPYAGAKRVFRVVDNGSSHRGRTAAVRPAAAFPNAVPVHTPVHASWSNPVEIFFSVVQRKVVQPDDFTDLAQARGRLQAFEDRCNAMAQPFRWRFTASDLDDPPARLDRRTLDRQESSAGPAA